MSRFVHLHSHTGYSLIDGLSKVGDMMAAAADDDQPALAVTDHGTLGGWFPLHQATASREGGPFAIYGAEMYLAVGSRHERNSISFGVGGDDDDDESKANYHLTLLAASESGYRNMIALNNAAQETFWHRPRIDLELLAQHGDGILVLTGCLGGPVASHLAHGDPTGAAANLAAIIAAVGPDQVYVELMEHGVTEETPIQGALVDLAREHGLRWVVTNDCHYTHEDDAIAHEAWLAVGTRRAGKTATLDDPDRWRFPGAGYWFKTSSQMRALRDEAWWHDGCDETVRVAERIGQDVMPPYPTRLPTFPLPKGYANAADYLRDLARTGAADRYGHDPQRPGRLPPDVSTRLRYEFDVVSTAGLADYFLIVWEMVRWAREQGILVGPGRGSAAGSALAYCLGITQVDPIANHLLFERFLNPDRAGMPDIDVDFERDRRGEVLDHLVDVFGAERVARIGTRGVVRSRQALKDAGRVLGMSPRATDKLAEMVPLDGAKPRSLTLLLGPGAASDPSTKPFTAALAAHGDEGQALVKLATRFEGVQRSESIHACGVVVSNSALDTLLPLRRDREGEKEAHEGEHVTRITTWEGAEVEAAGFLKMDVLGIRNLDVLALAARMVEQTTGERIDIHAINPDRPHDLDRDRAAWALIAAGRTEGVFQLESPQMTALAMDVRPTTLADIEALVALYRPGPMAAGMHTRYAARKNGRETVTYTYLTTDAVEQQVIASVLAETYGVIVYQEQLQRLGGEVAGLGAGMKNKLQKAFSKKKADLMEEVHAAFIEGGLAGAGPAGVRFAQKTLDALWETFEGSASYLFNASHAAAYGHLSYVTAYVKANWPVQFGAALLAATDRDDKRAAILRSLTLEGITINPPDVNHSTVATSVDPSGDGIRLGLAEVKGIGKSTHAIIAERDNEGSFTSVTDLMRRVQVAGPKGKAAPLPVADVEALIEAGALDAFGSRKGLMRTVRAARDHPTLTSNAEWGPFERSQRQRARTGVTLGEHPLRVHQDAIVAACRQQGIRVEALTPVDELRDVPDGHTVQVPGIVTQWTERAYSKGRMAAVVLEGGAGDQVELVVWDEDLGRMTRADQIPNLGHPVVVDAKVSSRTFSRDVTDDDGKVTTESVTRTSLTVRAIRTLAVQDGGVDDDALDDDRLLFIPRRSDNQSSTLVRALPRRGPAPEAPTHMVPPDALLHSGPIAWTRANRGPLPPLVYTVASASASLEDVRVAMDGNVEVGADTAGWTPITPSPPDTF